MIICLLTIAFFLRQNYKKRESHLMKSEIWYAAGRGDLGTKRITNTCATII